MTDHVSLTPLAVVILALLREGAMHPYEMIRLLRRRRAERLVAITNGTLYHTVGRLERCGLVAEVGVDREGNRPERTTYAATPVGLAAAVDWVRCELVRIDHPADFRVALAEAHNLEPAEVAALLRTRRTALAASLDDHRTERAASRAHHVPEHYLLEVDREEALLDRDLAWLEALIGRLERGELRWEQGIVPEFAEQYLADRKAARA